MHRKIEIGLVLLAISLFGMINYFSKETCEEFNFLVTDHVQEKTKITLPETIYGIWKDLYEETRKTSGFSAKIIPVDGCYVIVAWSPSKELTREQIQGILLEKISSKHPYVYASVVVK